MPWTEKYKTSFVEPIVNNLLAYIRTNQAAALLWANGGVIQPVSFAAIYNSRIGFAQETYPDLMVDRVTSKLIEKDDESGVEEVHQIWLIFELTGADATELTIRQWRYMKALDSMCRKIPAATLLTGVSGTGHCGTDVLSHDYGVLRGGGSQYFRMGILVFAVSLEEDRNNAAV